MVGRAKVRWLQSDKTTKMTRKLQSQIVPKGTALSADLSPPAVMRLLQAERSEEIYSLLIEEIMNLGYSRAALLTTDFETGEVVPKAALGFSDAALNRFRFSIYAGDHPMLPVIHGQKAAVLRKSNMHKKALYCSPMLYQNERRCWEAERERETHCLAQLNGKGQPRLNLGEQICTVCQMQAYAGLVVVEVPGTVKDSELAKLSTLIALANRYLSRLCKGEYYYNRMRDMTMVISQMETVMKSMADPVILTDARSNVLAQNLAAERFFKIPEEAGGEITEGRTRAVEVNNMLFTAAVSSMTVAGGESSRDLTLIDAMDGDELLFEAVCAPSLDRNGVLTGVVTVMRDVTDLRRADQQLQLNYEKLRTAEDIVRQDRDRLNLVIENVGDPIVVCDDQGKVVLLDPLATELLESTGSIATDAIRIKNQAVLDAYISKFTFSFASNFSGPLKLVDPQTREKVEFDAKSGKIFDERGQVSMTVTVLRDWSAVRKLEQLKLEKRMLEIEKFAASGRLAATIAHEVNNPMEAIKNSMYLLKGKISTEAQPVYEILISETQRVARIVRQMLGLYRNTESVKPIDINRLIEDTLMLLGRQLQTANVQLIKKLGELPETVASRDQLSQVLSNLIINAKDAMPGGGTLHLRTGLLKTEEDPHPWIQILVADTGSGIPEEMLQSVFEPFVSTKGEKGTGLGLWIVKGIMSNHGGKISVRSRVGKGTIFKIMLPVMQ